MTDIITAIRTINPNAECTVNAEDYNQITWLNGTTPISKTDIETKQAELQTAYDDLDYQRKRKAEYPSIEELVVALYDAEDKLAIENKRQAVKAKYPKGDA